MDFDGCGDYFAGDTRERDLDEHADRVSKLSAAQLHWAFEVRSRPGCNWRVLGSRRSTKKLRSLGSSSVTSVPPVKPLPPSTPRSLGGASSDFVQAPDQRLDRAL